MIASVLLEIMAHVRLECLFGIVWLTKMTEPARIRKAASRTALAIVALLFFGNPLQAKRKDDVVVMKNGDRLTGEIKKLDHGILYFKSSYMLQSVELDWRQVGQLESQDQFFFMLKDGKRYAAAIEKSVGKEAQPDTLHIEAQGKAMEVERLDVVSIQQKEESFWSQVNGSIDYGFSYTSGNSALSSSLGAAAQYLRDKDLVRLSTSSQFNTQSSGTSTNRFTFDGQYLRKISDRWFYGGLIDLLKSDQQNLDLRTTFGGLLGRTVVLTNKTSLRVFAGTVFSRERYFPQAGTTTIKDNGEAVIGANFYTFRFKVLDFRSTLLVYPSLTDPGRVRVSSDSNLHIELVKDFYWDFHLYENFDSRPPVNAPRNDSGVTTGFGWKF